MSGVPMVGQGFKWSTCLSQTVIGTVDQYADEAAVRHATLPLISRATSRSRRYHSGAITVDQLCEHF